MSGLPRLARSTTSRSLAFRILPCARALFVFNFILAMLLSAQLIRAEFLSSRAFWWCPYSLHPARCWPIAHDPPRRLDVRRTVIEAVARLSRKFGSPPLLDPEKDMKVRSSGYRKLRLRLDKNSGLLEKIPLLKQCASCARYCAPYSRLHLCAVSPRLGTSGHCHGRSDCRLGGLRWRPNVVTELNFVTIGAFPSAGKRSWSLATLLRQRLPRPGCGPFLHRQW